MWDVASLSPETMYLALNYGVMPFWALLILAPHFKATDFLVHSVFAPITLGVIYGWLLATTLFGGIPTPEGAGFMSLEGVMKLFTIKEAMLAGWAHYIVFDLFIGAWIGRDAQRIGLTHLIVAPCLLITFIIGPIGLLTYLMVRGISGKGGWGLFEG